MTRPPIHHRVFTAFLLSYLILAGFAHAATLRGYWEFASAASGGTYPGVAVNNVAAPNLVIEGTAPTYHASLADDATPTPVTTLNGVITTVQGTANRLRLTHGMAPNGGSTTLVNKYTLMFDVFSPSGSRGKWRCFYQADPTNTDDGEFFIKNASTAETIGIAEIGYSSTAMSPGKWHRVVISVNLGTSIVSYVDGALFKTHSASTLNSHFALQSQVLLFGDNNGENYALNVGAVAIWDDALSATEVAALGKAGVAVSTAPPPNHAPVITQGPTTALDAVQDGGTATGTLNATDADGDAISWSVTTAPSHGTAQISGANTNCSLSYAPAAGYGGTDSFVVRATDGTDSASVTVNVVVTAASATPRLVGLWEFNNPSNRSQATLGFDLEPSGAGFAAVAGMDGSDGAMEVGVGSYYKVTHGVQPNGGTGATLANSYALVWDIKVPAASATVYKCLLQTNTANNDDGDLFINPTNNIGTTAGLGGYSATALVSDTWYRVVLNVNNGTARDVWVNGTKVYTGTVVGTQDESRYGLGGQILAFADNDGEDGLIDVSNMAVYNGALSDSQIVQLGGPGTAFVKSNQSIAFGALADKTQGDPPFALNATASSGLPVSYVVVSGPATVAGNLVTLTGFGTVTIRASQAGDANYYPAADVLQSFTVIRANQAPVIDGVDVSSTILLRNGNLRLWIRAADPDTGDTLAYMGDFEGTGNPVILPGPVADHVYPNPGSYNLAVRVVDNHGLASADQVTGVQVDQAQTGAAGAFGPNLDSLVPAGGSFGGLSSTHDLSGMSAAVMGGINNLTDLTASMAWRDQAAGESGLLYSPVVRFSGFSDTGANVYVIRMTYDPALAGVNAICLGRYDGTAWVRAVDANTGGTANDLGLNHPYAPDTDFVLGNYGADAASHTVWAVVNQSGDFSAMRLNLAPMGILTVKSDQGTPVPAAGNHSYPEGTSVSCQVSSPVVINGGAKYVCQGWQLSGGQTSSGTDTSFSFPLTGDVTLTWLWVTSYWLDLTTAGGGALSKSSGWNAAGTNVVVDAQSSYGTGMFQSWNGDTDGCTISGTRITIPMDRVRGTITAQFKRSDAQLTVVSAHDSCVPAPGNYTYAQGTALTLSASSVIDNKTQYVPVGWTMSGDSPHVGSGTAFNMTLTRDSVLTWNWATNYWLDTAVSGGGTVSVASGWQAAGSNVMVVATPGTGMRFASWTGDTAGCVIGGDHIIVPITAGRGTLTANFVSDDDFTVVTLPDTQNYSSSYPSIYANQTSWIVNNKSALNIQFVSSEGDIVNTYTSSSEWANSVAAMNQLNGQVPYLMTVGNHDISGAQTDSNYLNNYGPNNSRWKTGGNYYPWYGGASPSGLSSYAKLTISGRPYLFLNLDMDCPTPELNWAQTVINANRNVLTFLTVHDWLAETGGSGSTGTGNGTRGRCHVCYTSVSQGNSPDAVWTNFVQPNNEIFAIICGHNFAQYNIAENNNAGKPVQEIMADYQTLPNGGNGFLRIMKFRPSQGTIENTTYSPYLGRYMTQPANSSDSTGMLDLTDPNGSAFTLNIDFDHRFDGSLSVRYAGGPLDGSTVSAAYRPGTAVLNTAPDVQSGQTLYTCSGWTLTGSQTDSGTGNSKSLVMNGDATLTWSWDTKYWLETSETGDGQVSVYSGWQTANTPVTLNAVPNGSATFLRWSGDIQGCAIQGAQITVPMNRAYGPITAEFSSPIPNYVLTVVSDQSDVNPAPGAYSYAPNDTVVCSAQNVVSGTTREYCTGWTTSNGGSGTGANVNVTMTGDTILTWLWQTQYRFDVQTQGPGVVDVDSGWYPAGANLTVHAAAGSHAHFVAWTGDLTGCTADHETLLVPMDRAHQGIAAVFAMDQVSLTVVSAHGVSNPAAGNVSYDYGSAVSVSVADESAGTMRYRCVGWQLEGGQPATGTGNQMTFTITQNAVLTWQWQTEVYLSVMSDGHGAITPMDAAGWHPLGSVLALQATPAPYYRFDSWSGDVTGPPATADLSVTMDQARNVRARFAPTTAAEGTPVWWLDLNHLASDGNWDAAEAADADGDGWSAACEFLAGTDPANALSTLNATVVAGPLSGQAQWPAINGWIYQIGFSTDLGKTFSMVGNVTGNGGQAVCDLPATPSGLVRIQTTPPTQAWDVPARANAVVRSMKLIPAGTFTMGENSSGADVEYPEHSVTITTPYEMDTYDVTVADWTAVCTWAIANGYDLNPVPLFDVPANHPIQAVSWYDAVKWCNARSEMEGRVPCYYTDTAGHNVYRSGQVDLGNANVNWQGNGYRLPTEAQWERAARGGLPHANFPWGDTGDASRFNVWQYWVEVLDYQAPTFPWTTPVGYFNGSQTPAGPDMANGYGLYDMAGNVWQWSWDRFAAYGPLADYDPTGPSGGDQRVNRGGSWWNNVDDARCAKRYPYTPLGDNVYGSIGFRCVRNAADITTAPVPAPTVAVGIMVGETTLQIGKSGSTLTQDRIGGLVTLTFGGTLTVTATGDPLAAGDRFHLFDAAAYRGAFDALQLPPLTEGLAWDVTMLGVDGSISIRAVTDPYDAFAAQYGLIGGKDGDDDHDGIPNEIERILGTDPTNPDDRLKLSIDGLSLDPAHGTISVNLRISELKPVGTYRIYWTDDLSMPRENWTLIRTIVPGAQATDVPVQDNPVGDRARGSAPRGFYQLSFEPAANP